MRRTILIGAATAAMLAFASSAASAQSIEQLEQLEPDQGQWQSEYNGSFGNDAFGLGHSLELQYGLTDNLVIGVEAEAEKMDGDLSFGEVGASAIFKIADPEEDPMGFGVMLSASTDGHRISNTELRFITEKQNEDWWLQGDLMLRHVHEAEEKGSLLAYGWNISRKVAGPAWLGLEGSGQAARLGGFSDGFEKGHFVGPALTLEFEPAEGHGGVDTEIGIAGFRRVGGDGPRNLARIFVQLTF